MVLKLIYNLIIGDTTMKTITINTEKLAKAMLASYKYNTEEEHKGALAMLNMIIGSGEMYDEVCEIAEKLQAEEKKNKNK